MEEKLRIRIRRYLKENTSNKKSVSIEDIKTNIHGNPKAIEDIIYEMKNAGEIYEVESGRYSWIIGF